MAACSGMVIMSPLDPATIDQNYKDKEKTKGIIVYRAIPRVEVDKFIQVNLPVSAGQPPVFSGECTPVFTQKIVSIADWEHPYRLHYHHGFLESYTFAATLTSDGILIGINTVSTPDQGKTFQNLASAASSGAAAVALVPMQPYTVTPVVPIGLTPKATICRVRAWGGQTFPGL
jgi:hypothetical protein